MCIWMLVTEDEYELPIMIADTAKELARMCGSTENAVKNAAIKYSKGIIKKTKFRRVKFKNEDWNDFI